MGTAINRLFAIIGYLIGCRPKTSIFIGLLIFAISIFGFIFRFDVRMDLKGGFTRNDAPSYKEIKAHIDFFGNLGEPWYMAVFAEAKNEDLLRETESDEILSFFDYITKKMEIEYDGKKYTYHNDLCEPFCNFNGPLWNLLQYQSLFNIRYPVSTIGPYKMNVGKYIFNRTVDRFGTVTKVGTIATYFTTFVANETKAELLKIFEKKVGRAIQIHNSNINNTVKLVLHGVVTVSTEVEKGILQVTPHYFTGAALLVVFVIIALICSCIVYDRWIWSRTVLIIAAIISPILAAFTGIGYLLLFGGHINMLVLFAPFLTLAIGIGVDDSFLMTNTWLSEREAALKKSHKPSERLQLVFERIGAAMATTSITNVVGFLLACVTPVPEIRMFCGSVALCMIFDLVFEFLIYAPLHVILSSNNPIGYRAATAKSYVVPRPQRMKISFKSAVASYTEFLSSFWSEMLVMAFLISYLYVSIQGIRSLGSDMDGSDLLPTNSPSREGIRIMSNIVWPNYLNINYIIRRPPNFADPEEYRRFDKMVRTVESMEDAIGPEATMMWNKDYLRYLANPQASKLDVIFSFFGYDDSKPVSDGNGLDLSLFQQFINTDPYSAWKQGVRYSVDANNQTQIKSMLMIVAYKGTKTLADKAKLLSRCRQMADKFPEYNMIPFDTDAQLIDVLLEVPETTWKVMVFTVVAMGLVFFCFASNITSAIISSFAVASICTGVLGTMHYWGCVLDPITMVAVIITAGLGTDYVTHMCFHYVMIDDENLTKSKRLNYAFRRCALASVQAAISTSLVMIPVLFAPVMVYVVIAKAIILVVVFGIIHGFFVIPVVLTSLPSSFTSKVLCPH
ncbi:hypothetical protein AB6A40_004675 [Gnathostoma spinigerum]|uniref:SSD domain-containing protein n=1 Tax=Gnathostoma spinigerum TaxID=75299 RepID=A0ABD6EKM6_9BILA